MDLTKYITKTAGCPQFGDFAIKNKLTVKWGSAKRGDIVLFDFNNNGTSDHIGIVTKVTSSYIETVEGNTGNGSNTNGDGVYRRKRYKSQVNYFVRPKMPEEYRELIIATAESQLGYKEGRGNSNKYGKAFGMNNCSWCCIFVWWCFKNCKGKVEKISKPTGKHSIWLSSTELKLGSKGLPVKNLQDFLNWYHPAWKLVRDGEFGNLTDEAVRAFQRAEGLTVDGIFGAKSRAKANAYHGVSSSSAKPTQTTTTQTTPKPTQTVAKPAAPVKKKYAGAFPDFVALSGDIISELAKDCAHPKGTAKKKYKYQGGKPYGAYPKTLKKAYPDRSNWSARPKAGSSCDVFVGTIVRASGADKKYPRGLEQQLKYKSANFKEVTGAYKAGDIVRYSTHTLVIVDVGGVLYEAEASYGTKGAKYSKYPAIYEKAKKKYKKKNVKVLRCKVAIRDYIKSGDRGAEVKKLQAFLNWFGAYGLKLDGKCEAKTVAAIREFQLKQGLSGDGMFGVVSLKKAREVTR